MANSDNGPGASMPMGGNGVISNGGGPNVAGPAMAKPESKGNLGRVVAPLTPFSQVRSTPVGIVDDDAWANNDARVGAGGSGKVAPLTPSNEHGSTQVDSFPRGVID